MRLKFWQSDKTSAASAQPAAAPVAAPSAQTAATRPPAPPVKKPAPAEPAGVLGDLDLSAVGNALLRKKAWIIIPTAIVAALSFAVVNLVTPRYKSEAR